MVHLRLGAGVPRLRAAHLPPHPRHAQPRPGGNDPRGLPPLLHRGGTFAEALAATFEMFLRRVSKKGRVELRPMQPHTNRLVCDVSWE
ncbi:hypothetical protein ACN28S_41155 [Cystobacter fuscus]